MRWKVFVVTVPDLVGLGKRFTTWIVGRGFSVRRSLFHLPANLLASLALTCSKKHGGENILRLTEKVGAPGSQFHVLSGTLYPLGICSSVGG